MPMNAEDIVSLIKEGVPGAEVEITDLAGDGDHYKAVVTSDAFSGMPRVKQHQMVYAALGDKMKADIHALSMKTVVPEE